MKKVFLMVAATAAMLATGFIACKSNPPQPPKEIDILWQAVTRVE